MKELILAKVDKPYLGEGKGFTPTNSFTLDIGTRGGYQIAQTILTRYWKGISGNGSNCVVEVEETDEGVNSSKGR